MRDFFDVALAQTGIPAGIFVPPGDRWIGVAVGPVGGALEPELKPRTPLVSVPYAYHASSATRAEFAVNAGTATFAQSATTASFLLGGAGGGAIPPRGIIMWFGFIADIPTGWALCDGTNGTPDLRARFIRGAPAGTTTTDPGVIGGQDSMTLTTAQMPSHAHGMRQPDIGGKNVGNVQKAVSHDPTHNNNIEFPNTNSSGGNQPFDNRPAYFELAFIMKLP